MATLVFAYSFDAGRPGDSTTGSCPFIKEQSTGVGGSLTYQAGPGNYHFVGGNMTGTRGIQENLISGNPWGGLENWYCARFNFAAFPNSGLSQMIMALSLTDEITPYTGQKSQVWILSSGKAQLKMEQAPFSTQDGAVALSTGVDYIFVLHGTNGTNVDQELRIYDGTTGALIDTIIQNLTTAGAGDLNTRLVFGLRSAVDCTGLDFTGDEIAIFTGAGNPGPCRVAAKFPASVASAGGWTATGAANVALAVDETGGNDGDTTRAQNDTTVTTVNTCVLSLGNLNLASVATFRGVACNTVWKSAGAPTHHVGVQVGSSVDASDVGAAVSGYRPKQQIKTTNPATSLPWAVGDIDSIEGVLRDADGVTTAFQVTQAFWDVVYELLPPAGGGGSPPVPPPAPPPSVAPAGRVPLVNMQRTQGQLS